MANASTTPCPECQDIGYFFSDNGPSPREIACDCCGGAGVWPEDAHRHDDDTVEALVEVAAKLGLKVAA